MRFRRTRVGRFPLRVPRKTRGLHELQTQETRRGWESDGDPLLGGRVYGPTGWVSLGPRILPLRSSGWSHPGDGGDSVTSSVLFSRLRSVGSTDLRSLPLMREKLIFLLSTFGVIFFDTPQVFPKEGPRDLGTGWVCEGIWILPSLLCHPRRRPSVGLLKGRNNLDTGTGSSQTGTLQPVCESAFLSVHLFGVSHE